MRLPKLPNHIRHHKTEILPFLGLNLTDNTRDGEFQDMEGLSSSRYPYLSQIKERRAAVGPNIVQDMFAWNDYLFVSENQKLRLYQASYYPSMNGKDICELAHGATQWAVINSKLVIFPEKIYVDLNTIDYPTVEVHSLKQKSLEYDAYNWTAYSITATGLGSQLAVGDTVDVLGSVYGIQMVVSSIDEDTVNFQQTKRLQGNGEGKIYIESSVPDLYYICSHANRIWGLTNYPDFTVYASALGDPTSFFDYSGDAGAYAAAVGSPGAFTGICEYGGDLLIWKENTLHKMIGSNPSEYYMVDYPIYGVQQGSSKSLININNVLYYKGEFGVYRYTGTTPVLISRVLGEDIGDNCVAGTDGIDYYLSAYDNRSISGYSLYKYDISNDIWMLEDRGDGVTRFECIDRYLYYISSGKIYRIERDVSPSLEWFGEFVPFTENTFSRKGYTRLLIHMDMSADSSVKIKVKQDRRGYRTAWEQQATARLTATVPIRLGRSYRFTLRIEGKGEVLIRGIGRDFVTGSEVN